MKLTSFWTESAVYWRVFNWDDMAVEWLKIGIAEGILRVVGESMTRPDARFQMELKRDSLGGAFILHSNRNRLFLQGRHYVLRASGTVDEFQEPTLQLTTPAANDRLDQSRLGDRGVAYRALGANTCPSISNPGRTGVLGMKTTPIFANSERSDVGRYQ